MTTAEYLHRKIVANLRALAAKGDKAAAKRLAEAEAVGRAKGWTA